MSISAVEADALRLQLVVWASTSSSSVSCYSAFSSRPAVRGLSVHSTVFVWVFCQHVRGRFSILTPCVCVCVYVSMWVSEWDMVTRQRWWAVSCCLDRTLLDPLSFLSPFVREYKDIRKGDGHWRTMLTRAVQRYWLMRCYAVPAGCVRQVWL